MTKYTQMLKKYYSKDTFCNYSPLHIYIEPTNICNLECSQCSHSIMKRKKGNMKFSFYKNLVDQCKEMEIQWIYLFNIGESALCPGLGKMIDYAKSKDMKIRLHTNGTQNVDSLKVDELHISLNKTDFALIKENIDKLIFKNIDFKLDFIKGVSKPIPDIYKKYVFKKEYYNWQGDVGKSKMSYLNVICSHPYKSMVVFYDGLCVPCCVDYDGKWVIGDAKKSSLKEIWNSKKMQTIREKPVKMCSSCNLKRLPEKEIIK